MTDATARPDTGGLGELAIAAERRPDGSLLVSSTVALPAHPPRMTDHLEHWATAAPDRVFLAKREAGGDWRRIGYGAARLAARTIAAALIERGLSRDCPIAILSGNDIDSALLMLGAMYAGIPTAPISPAYSLLSSDHAKLAQILAQLEPQLVFVEDAGRFERAIMAAVTPDVEVVAGRDTLTNRGTTSFADLIATHATAAVDEAHATVDPDSIAKILFTSGSTGAPKGVITTHRMLTANQAMLRYWLSSVGEEPPMLLDWLPWSHTFGGSHNFGLVLANGGTLYIDDGRPTPQGIAETIRNLREVSPTLYFNVPSGFEALATAMQGDAALAQKFFARLRFMFYAAASLPTHVWRLLDKLATSVRGAPLPMLSGFGATETAPAALASTPTTAALGTIGLPLPGVTLKLVRTAEKLEARLRSPALMPGYWKNSGATTAAFDEGGFYKLGDAFRLADSVDVSKGFIFDGRLTEDFKLTTGTWVSVGPLRQNVLAALAPLARDVVIAGHDRRSVGALVFADIAACRALMGETGGTSDAEVLASPPVRYAIRDRLRTLADEKLGSSMQVKRLLLMAEPASIDAGEITDKGSINQRAVLARRAALVEALYGEPPPPDVISA